MVNPVLASGMAMIFGIDKFFSECRALTNLIGNGVAAVVVSVWEGELDQNKLNAALSGSSAPELPLVIVAAE